MDRQQLGAHTMKNTLVVAVASAFVLSGCAGMNEEALKVKCDVGPITVTVISGITGVTQDPIIVGDKNKWICWQLDPNAAKDYKFTADSIYINDNDDEFSNCKQSKKGGDLEGDTKIACHDKNNKHGQGNKQYKYSVQVFSRDPKIVPTPGPYDPWIVNN
jgi:hypothetical protein